MAGAAGGADLALIAYRLYPWSAMRIVTAAPSRPWMSASQERFAYRCLPLLMANQAGWFILSSHALRATWAGGDDPSSLAVDYVRGYAPYPAVSHFGHGILTWNIPYLFRTTPGYNLLARGPANWPKDGACPLEGVVETDWAVATFTMNWKLTRINHPVFFDVDEPICMIVPQRRGELERFAAETRAIESDPRVEAGYRAWASSRHRFLEGLGTAGSRGAKGLWQKHYFRGVGPGGHAAPDHELKMGLRDFEEADRRGARGGRPRRQGR